MTEVWPDYRPAFTPGGREEYEHRAWETREYRIGCGWAEQEAAKAYEAEMSAEGYEREAEIG